MEITEIGLLDLEEWEVERGVFGETGLVGYEGLLFRAKDGGRLGTLNYLRAYHIKLKFWC